jgi:hypothetical protein
MVKKCCAKCIGDKYFDDAIQKFHSESGTCSYCHSENQQLVLPVELGDRFELLINIYSPNNDGKTLVEWLKDDWGIFPTMDIANSQMLLTDILDNGELVRAKFAPSDSCHSNRVDLWKKLRNELMCENRFFLQTELDKDELERWLDLLAIKLNDVTQDWYRARVQHTKDHKYAISEMSAPPKELSSQGRANPAGIPYLYLASNLKTAICEIRPHTGEIVDVAKFINDSGLEVIDLRNPRKTISPFALDDEDDIARLRGGVELLEHLGNELTRPVLPKAAAIDYLPSQYLCEFIKKCGYDGVIYESSVGDGTNLALFDPIKASGSTVEQHKVSRVLIEYSAYSLE